MTEQGDSIRSLLENNAAIRKKVSAFIQEEVIVPEGSDDGSDIEIIEENISQRTIEQKRKRELKLKLKRLKKASATPTYEDPYSNVCGFRVHVKSLLENEAIRQQIAPFISEEVIIPDWSDSSVSDTEEVRTNVSAKVAKIISKSSSTSLKKLDKQRTECDTAYEVPPIEQILIPELPHFSDLSEVESHVFKNLGIGTENELEVPLMTEFGRPNLSCSSDTKRPKKSTSKKSSAAKANNLIENTADSCINEDIQILNLVDSSDDEIIIDEKTSKESNNHIPNENDLRKKLTSSVENLEVCDVNCENVIIDENLLVANALDQKTSEDNENLDLPLVESDDWYYLNIVTNPETENSDNLSKIRKKIEGQLVSMHDVAQRTYEKPIKSKKNGVRKRRHKHHENFQHIVKLQGRIRKKSLANVNTAIQHLNDDIDLTGKKLLSAPLVLAAENFCVETEPDNKINSTYNNTLVPIAKDEAPTLHNCDAEARENTTTNVNEFEKQKDANGKVANTLSKIRIRTINEELAFDPNDLKKEPETNDETEMNCFGDSVSDFDERESDASHETQEQVQLNKKAVIDKIQLLEKKRININSKSKYLGRCLKCGKRFERIGNLRRHESKCKTIVNLYECVMCPFTTKNKNYFKNHLGKHILGTAYGNISHPKRAKFNFRRKNKNKQKAFCPPDHLKALCVNCHKETTAVERTVSCKKCHQVYVYFCAMCGCDFATYTRLRIHVLTSLNKTFHSEKCSKCNMGGHQSSCALKKHQALCGTNSKCDRYPYVSLERIEVPKIDKENDPSKDSKVSSETIGEGNKNTSHFAINTRYRLENKSLNQSIQVKRRSIAAVNFAKKQKRKRKSVNTSLVNKKTFPLAPKALDTENHKIAANGQVQSSDSDESNVVLNNVVVNKKIKTDSNTNEFSSNIQVTEQCSKSSNGSAIEGSCINNILKISNEKQIGLQNFMKRYCTKCHKTKRILKNIKRKTKKHVCGKCRTVLLYQCIKCNEKFKSYRTILYHLYHTCITPLHFQCVEQPFTKTFSKSLSRNKVKKIFSIIGIPQHENCLKCGKIFEDYTDMKTHQLYCKIIKKYHCKVCPYKSNYKSKLKLHSQLHIEKKIEKTETLLPNQNDIPGLKKSTSRSDLIKAECSNCNDTTIALKSKKNCSKCGNGLSYRCAVCNKLFEFKSGYWSARYHARKHRVCKNKRHLNCAHCSFTTKVCKSLTEHLISMHSA